MFKIKLKQLIVVLIFARGIDSILDRKRCEGLEAFEDIDCEFSPDDDLDVPQIIRRHGYPVEAHTIETDDGYLLTVHRIPGSRDGKRGGQAVYLQHGMLGSSADWILNGNNSFGFLLADQGYDVWLGNARGNTYSKGHVSLPVWSSQYWNFSWHEMGVYDLPATLYHISNTTGALGDIIYVGHSMGTTQFFVFASTQPQAAKNVKLMIALAPIAYMTHLTSPLRYLAPFVNDIQWVAEHLGVNEFMPNDKLMQLLRYECQQSNVGRICQNLVMVLFGFDAREFNREIIPAVLGHDPAGTSTKTVIHYVQEMKYQGNFQQYDYGTEGNMIKYGTPTPPLYKLENIKRPVYLMYAKNDILASPIDVGRLIRKLVNLVGAVELPTEIFGHIDFVFGKDAYELVYQPALKVMRNFTQY